MTAGSGGVQGGPGTWEGADGRPARCQLRRSKGWRKPAGAVVVARPSRWGNPFSIADAGSRAEAVARYRVWVAAPEQADLRAAARRELAGKVLCCWCPLGGPCHAEVLIDIANGPEW
jgi:hypothetical protein